MLSRIVGAPAGEPPEFYREYLLLFMFLPSAILSLVAGLTGTFNIFFWIGTVTAIACAVASRRRHYLILVLVAAVVLRLLFGLAFISF